MSTSEIQTVQNRLAFHVDPASIQQLIQISYQYPREIVHLPYAIRDVMKAASKFGLIGEQTHNLVVTVMMVSVIDKLTDTSMTSEFMGVLDNIVRVYYGLSKHDNIFISPIDSPTIEFKTNDPAVDAITGRLTFEVDVNIINQLIHVAREWALNLLTLPLVLREVMKSMSIYGNNLSSYEKEELVVAVLSVLVIQTVANTDMHETLIQTIHGLVKTYYAISTGVDIFSKNGESPQLVITGKCCTIQ